MSAPHVPGLLLVAVALAGCGHSADKTQTTGTTQTAPSVAPSAATSPAALPSTVGSPVPSATATSPTVARQDPVSVESNPPGDIPDNLAFVPYVNAVGGYRFVHPEGWTESTRGTRTLCTDKLNGVEVRPGAAGAPPTLATARAVDVPGLQAGQPAFELREVTATTEPAGRGVLIVYRRNSAPDAVTGRQYRDEVQRYELVQGGHELVMELYGPVGADNVDAYRTMVQSLRPR